MNSIQPQKPIRILIASSEAQGLIGSSDLATFSTTLATTLGGMGHDIRLVLPAYPQLLTALNKTRQVSRVRVIGSESEARLLQGKLGQQVTLYLVDIPGQFDRPGNPYQDDEGIPWPDNGIRYGLFSRVVALIAINQAGLNWQPELLHCNGWQAGLAIPLLMGEWSRPATVYTQHAIEQPFFSGEEISQLSLPIELLKSGILAMDGQFSFEKGALLKADWLSLPSSGYRTELLKDDINHPFTELFKQRQDRLVGIASGIDYHCWSPTTDPYIDQHFDASSFELKKINRLRLQSEQALPLEDKSLLIGYVGLNVTLAETNLVSGLIKELTSASARHIFASVSGEPAALQPLIDCAKRLPQSLTLKIGEDETLKHKILAGSDCLLLPNPHYPSACQAQLALSYGTVPIAHATGSILEVVTDATPANLLHGAASGFLYSQNAIDQLINAFNRVDAFREKPAIWWQKLALHGMSQSFHATEAANRYLDLYHSAIDNPAPASA